MISKILLYNNLYKHLYKHNLYKDSRYIEITKFLFRLKIKNKIGREKNWRKIETL